MNKKPLHISIVDNDPELRDMLLLLLGSLGCPMQTFASGIEFLEKADMNAAGCVILDMDMESRTAGLDVFAEMRACKSPKVVLFLSAYGTIPVALAQTQKGAFDWLVKPVDGDTLKQRVREAMLKAQRRSDAKDIWGTLTPREKEVMRLVARGMTSKQIAETLTQKRNPENDLDSRTVDTFRAAGRDKTGINNQADMRAWMIENAWLTDFVDTPVETSLDD